jgi:CheY-like chemotaxis protein
MGMHTEQSSPPTPTPTPTPSSVAVLVLDDGEVLRHPLSHLMRAPEYAVFAAPGGKTAVERLRNHPGPMVVVLDWCMPSMDGVQVLQALAANTSAMQSHSFIVLTAANYVLRERLSRDLAALPSHLSVMVLSKPFDEEFLLTLVAHAAAQLAHDT